MKKTANLKTAFIALLVFFGMAGGVLIVQAKSANIPEQLTPTSIIDSKLPALQPSYPKPQNPQPYKLVDPNATVHQQTEDMLSTDTCLNLNDATYHNITANTVICTDQGDYFYNGADMYGFINILADNITLDCQGAKIYSDNVPDSDPYTSTGGWGIIIGDPNHSYSNVTIKNCVIEKFYTDIYKYSNSNNTNIHNNSLINSEIGLLSRGIATNSHIYNNSLIGDGIFNDPNDQKIGILLEAENNGLFEYNTFTNLNYNGILLNSKKLASIWYFPHDNIFRNNLMSNVYRGIVLTSGAYNNTIQDNQIDASDVGIYFYHYTDPANKILNNTVIKNSVTGGSNNIGIMFEASAGDNNTLKNNHLKNATAGRGLYLASGNNNNVILQNSFINNLHQAYDNGSGNIFDQNGKGNRWSTFDEPSEGCHDADGNGICEESYTGITGDAGSIDHYPTTGQITLAPINPITANELDTVIVDMAATDPEGDKLTYSIEDPRFYSLESCVGDPSVWGWSTNKYSAGHYFVMAKVTDGDYIATQQAEIIVNDTCHLDKWGKMVCSAVRTNISCL
ncbi:MAG: right-handed parallel beta-helix repeat-containing protein [Patescibacteria group bacterium]|jgi:nitrous oxidase accessory protein NosD